MPLKQLPDPAAQAALLRAVGIDISAPPAQQRQPLDLDLDAMRRLLPGLRRRVDACRDRQGTTALGVAAYYGRVEAMVLLLEHGADVGAENLDGSTPLSMACFGKSAMAMALLLVYGGYDIDPTDALSDAHAIGADEVVALLEAWDDGSPHPLLEEAQQRYEGSRSALASLQAEIDQEARVAEQADEESRVQALERRLIEALGRAENAEARVCELEKSLKQALARQPPPPLPQPARLPPPSRLAAKGKGTMRRLFGTSGRFTSGRLKVPPPGAGAPEGGAGTPKGTADRARRTPPPTAKSSPSPLSRSSARPSWLTRRGGGASNRGHRVDEAELRALARQSGLMTSDVSPHRLSTVEQRHALTRSASGYIRPPDGTPGNLDLGSSQLSPSPSQVTRRQMGWSPLESLEEISSGAQAVAVGTHASTLSPTKTSPDADESSSSMEGGGGADGTDGGGKAAELWRRGTAHAVHSAAFSRRNHDSREASMPNIRSDDLVMAELRQSFRKVKGGAVRPAAQEEEEEEEEEETVPHSHAGEEQAWPAWPAPAPPPKAEDASAWNSFMGWVTGVGAAADDVHTAGESGKPQGTPVRSGNSFAAARLALRAKKWKRRAGSTPSKDEGETERAAQARGAMKKPGHIQEKRQMHVTTPSPRALSDETTSASRVRI